MPAFDDYLRRITERLDLSPSCREEIRDEARSHLEDEAERLVKSGTTRVEAETLAIESFGKDDTIAALVSQALARRQERHRRVRTAMTVAGTVLLAVFVVGLGAWFSVFDDSVSGQAFVSTLPRYLFPVLYVGAWVWGLAILAAVAYRLSGAGKWPLIVAALAVLLAFFLATLYFDLLPLRGAYGYITGHETPRELAIHAFVMRAWLTMFPACLVGAVSLVLSRERRQTARLAALALMTGLLSAVLMAAMRLASNLRTSRYYWLTAYKWPKLLSTGLVALVFVLLTIALARSLSSRRPRPAAAPSTAGSGHG